MPRPQIYVAWVHCLGQCSPYYGGESRSATRSSDSFCLTGELLSPTQSEVKRNLSQSAKSRIAHLGPISRRHSERKSPIDQGRSPDTSRIQNFLPLTFGPKRASLRFYLQPTTVCKPEAFLQPDRCCARAIGCKLSRQLR